MKLQTKIPFKKQSDKFLIDYDSCVFLLGSCFSENIGDTFEYYKFNACYNPLGILFHPLAIGNLVSNALKGKIYLEEDVFLNNEQWHCFDAHSRLSNVTKENLLSVLNIKINLTKKQLEKATHIIITLGTAWVYRFLETNQVVANCHKVPQRKFKKELLAINEIANALENIVELITEVNHTSNIIFTVSPVRHLKDGFVENTLSKAHLISAIHQVVEIKNNCFYFPSYEIVLDELRDYRFYNEDMVHPNPLAINYVWEKFQEVWFTNEAVSLSKKIDTIQKSLNHKPFNPNSEAHKVFLKNIELEKNQLKALLPNISF